MPAVRLNKRENNSLPTKTIRAKLRYEEKEVDKIMGRIKEGTLAPKTQVTFDIGEQVKICEGAFRW